MKALYEDLLKDGIMIPFHVDENLASLRAYNAETGEIFFRSPKLIIGDVLIEEFVHAAQVNLFYSDDFLSIYRNIEFEAKMFIDIITFPSGYKVSMFLVIILILLCNIQTILILISYKRRVSVI